MRESLFVYVTCTIHHDVFMKDARCASKCTCELVGYENARSKLGMKIGFPTMCLVSI